jgi:DNA-binding beta-propeller fold protein YncE
MRIRIGMAASAIAVATVTVAPAGALPAPQQPAAGLLGSPTGCAPLSKSVGYAANFGDDNVVKLDLRTNTVIGTLTGFSNPWGLELNSNGSLLYVDSVSPTDPRLNEIQVVDTCTDKIIKEIPTIGPGYLQVSPDHKWLYAPNLFADGIQVINTETAEVHRTYLTAPLTQGGVSNDQRTMWAEALPDLVYTIDMVTGLPSGPPLDLEGIEPLQFTMSPDGGKLAIADFVDRVAIVDTQPGSPTYRTVTQSVYTGAGSQPGISAYSPDGRYLWVGGYSGQVSVLDLQERTFTCWNLQANAFGTTVSKDGKRVYVTATPNGTVQPGTGFGVLGLESLELYKPGGVIHVYDAQEVYETMPFGTRANCSATEQTDGPELGSIPVGNVPIALATLDSAGHVG